MSFTIGLCSRNSRRNTVILCLLVLSFALNGQTFSFKNYNTENGLPNKFVYTINQDERGFMWIGTGAGLVRFDGINFVQIQYPDSVSTPYPVVTLKDKSGTLWFGFSDGSLFYSVNDSIIRVEGIASSKINDLFEGTDGFVYVVSENQSILKIDKEKHIVSSSGIVDTDQPLFSARMVLPDYFLIGTQENLLYCKKVNDTLEIENVIEGVQYTKIQSVYPVNAEGTFLIATEYSGVFIFNTQSQSKEAIKLEGFPSYDDLRIQSVTSDRDGYFWISTYGYGVFKVRLSSDSASIDTFQIFDNKTGLTGNNNIKNVFQDREGNIWIGLYGDGLSLLKSDAYTYFVPGNSPETNNIIYINRSDDRYFLGTPTGFHIFDLAKNKSEGFTDLSGQLSKREIISYYLDSGGNLYIGTAGGGLYIRNKGGSVRQLYKSGNSGSDYINNIKVDASSIWLATLNGVVVLDKATGMKKVSYTTLENLPHNSINQILVTEEGIAIPGTQSTRLYHIDLNEGVIEGEEIMTGFVKNVVGCFTLDQEGGIWAGTLGNGMFGFINDSVYSLTTADGLMSNYCYSILADRDNKIWIGHERGFSRFDLSTGRATVMSTDFAGGGDCNPDALFESDDAKIFIGTSQGLIVYDSRKDHTGTIAPSTNIISITINDISYPVDEAVSLPYSKNYNIEIEYIGINLGDPEKVYYSTYLENWDNGWSDNTASRFVNYKLVNSFGSYRFNLISFNEAGLAEDMPLNLDITIKRPFWKTWWFRISAVFLVLAIVIIIVRIRERAQKKIQQYLETELEARTREVVHQKEEIELQNLEITDSINYAKRIQSSILPDINRLKENFRDAFIIFHPRDIVSGDYYWFDKIDDEKFIIVCADSTGHGVPGAFMSMIGSTLLQDIVTRKRITKPSEILTLLDSQIFSTLNQNVDLGVSNDGMDMVICEFNIRTRHMRFSSAMRPVVIVMSKEVCYIKGNRSSVGGEASAEKYFDDQEYYLKEGDTVYMFSDGYPDQFGGGDGKKMKIARLKRLIEEVNDFPMDVQKQKLEEFFIEWKGSYEQVDDILFMGIRV